MSATPSPSSLSGKLPSVLPALTSSSSHGGSHRFQPLTDQHQDDLEDHQVTIELGRVGIFDEDYAMEASSPSKEDKSTTAGKDENSPQASVASHDDRPALMSSINGVQPTVAQQVEGLLQAYWKKFQGVPDKKPPAMTPFIQMLVSSVLGFIGIFLVSVTDYWYLSKDYQFDGKGLTMLTGAYAATAGKYYYTLICDCMFVNETNGCVLLLFSPGIRSISIAFSTTTQCIRRIFLLFFHRSDCTNNLWIHRTELLGDWCHCCVFCHLLDECNQDNASTRWCLCINCCNRWSNDSCHWLWLYADVHRSCLHHGLCGFAWQQSHSNSTISFILVLVY